MFSYFLLPIIIIQKTAAKEKKLPLRKVLISADQTEEKMPGSPEEKQFTLSQCDAK